MPVVGPTPATVLSLTTAEAFGPSMTMPAFW